MAHFLAALASVLVLLATADAFPICSTGPLGYYPKVQAISGNSQFLTTWVQDYAHIKPCPSGYHDSTADSEVEITRNIMDAYFIQKVAPVYKGFNSCKSPADYLYPDGKPVGSIVSGGSRYTLKVTDAPHHYGVSGCIANNMKRGVVYTGYAQGVLNYYCKSDSRKKVKQVALIYTSGKFTAQ